MTEPTQNFQVDLHGLVDLLSHHLYSSPRVYVRELMQNAVDAITARRAVDAECPMTVAFTTSPTGLTIDDSGIGLRRDQVTDFLATIGRSSKRDDIGFARDEFLGQFGIGLLSAFMVADEIRVLTRPLDGPSTLWVGTGNGQYTIEDTPALGRQAAAPLGSRARARPPDVRAWNDTVHLRYAVRS